MVFVFVDMGVVLCVGGLGLEEVFDCGNCFGIVLMQYCVDVDSFSVVY